MWKKSDSHYQQPEPSLVTTPNATDQLRERALIGSSILIKGDVSGDEDLTIQGRVEGRIDLRRNNVTIGKNGHIKADIIGKIVSIEGEVQGNVFGEEKIIIRSSGSLRGNITAPRVNLEEGSKFKGTIDMDSAKADKPSAAEPTSQVALPEAPADSTQKFLSDQVRKREEEKQIPLGGREGRTVYPGNK